MHITFSFDGAIISYINIRFHIAKITSIQMWLNCGMILCFTRLKNRVEGLASSKVMSKSGWGIFSPPSIGTERVVKLIGITRVRRTHV